MSVVGYLIRNERKRVGLTQDALAAAVGCSKGQLSLMESGQRNVSEDRAAAIESALGITDGRILEALRWDRTPPEMRARVEASDDLVGQLARVRVALDSDQPIEALRKVVEQTSSNVEGPLRLRRRIPVINNVAAGYPTEFTDLDHPPAVADDYLAITEVTDPDAFAARVVGDSMEPVYREGETVVFAPSAPTPSGTDCFVRLERDNESTFKRVYFEDEGRMIRLQPLNPAYPPRVVDREDVNAMYAASYVIRRIGG